jgi:hypothetical protein
MRPQRLWSGAGREAGVAIGADLDPCRPEIEAHPGSGGYPRCGSRAIGVPSWGSAPWLISQVA